MKPTFFIQHYSIRSFTATAGIDMFKAALLVYITCFGLYILFSRQPDYFDGEIVPAVIHFTTDSISGESQPVAVFSDGRQTHQAAAAYPLRRLEEGNRVLVIFERSQPDYAAVYSWWGYWLTWGEILFSAVLMFAMYKIATSVTDNPSPESLVEQMEYKPRKRRKYED